MAKGKIFLVVGITLVLALHVASQNQALIISSNIDLSIQTVPLVITQLIQDGTSFMVSNFIKQDGVFNWTRVSDAKVQLKNYSPDGLSWQRISNSTLLATLGKFSADISFSYFDKTSFFTKIHGIGTATISTSKLTVLQTTKINEDKIYTFDEDISLEFDPIVLDLPGASEETKKRVAALWADLGLPLVQETLHQYLTVGSRQIQAKNAVEEPRNFSYFFMGTEMTLTNTNTENLVTDYGLYIGYDGKIIGYPTPLGPRREIDIGSADLGGYTNAELGFAIKSNGFDQGYFSWKLNKENYIVDDSFTFTAGDLARVVPKILDIVDKSTDIIFSCSVPTNPPLFINTERQVLETGFPVNCEVISTDTQITLLTFSLEVSQIINVGTTLCYATCSLITLADISIKNVRVSDYDLTDEQQTLFNYWIRSSVKSNFVGVTLLGSGVPLIPLGKVIPVEIHDGYFVYKG